MTAVRLPRWSCTIACRVPARSVITVSPPGSYRYVVTRPNGLVWRTTRPSVSYSLRNAPTPSGSTTATRYPSSHSWSRWPHSEATRARRAPSYSYVTLRPSLVTSRPTTPPCHSTSMLRPVTRSRKPTTRSVSSRTTSTSATPTPHASRRPAPSKRYRARPSTWTTQPASLLSTRHRRRLPPAELTPAPSGRSTTTRSSPAIRATSKIDDIPAPKAPTRLVRSEL